MQASGNASALQWLVISILLASLHQARHLILSELNLAATKRRKTDVSDLELVGGSRHFGGCLMYYEGIPEQLKGSEEEERMNEKIEERIPDF